MLKKRRIKNNKIFYIKVLWIIDNGVVNNFVKTFGAGKTFFPGLEKNGCQKKKKTA